MNGRRWIVLTIATVLAVIAVNGIVAYVIDPFGVLRDPRGRMLPINLMTSGRKAKFLLSQRYVPENYDALIVGPSSVANWDVDSLAGTHVYNLALDGGNAAEEKVLLDEALRRGHYRLAIVALVPVMTWTHDVRGGLDTTSITEALGSIQSYIQEGGHVLRSLHHGAGFVDIAANGHYNYRKRNDLAVVDEDQTLYKIDPMAMQQDREIVEELQRQGTTIVYVVPPLYEPFYLHNKAGYDDYLRRLIPQLPVEPVIDFRAPEYAALRSDPGNFVDVQHLEPGGAKLFSALLQQRVSAAVGTPR